MRKHRMGTSSEVYPTTNLLQEEDHEEVHPSMAYISQEKL